MLGAGSQNFGAFEVVSINYAKIMFNAHYFKNAKFNLHADFTKLTFKKNSISGLINLEKG